MTLTELNALIRKTVTPAARVDPVDGGWSHVLRTDRGRCPLHLTHDGGDFRPGVADHLGLSARDRQAVAKLVWRWKYAGVKPCTQIGGTA